MLILVIVILLVGGYYANSQFELVRNPFETPTPTLTPTRTTLSYLAEAQAYYEQGKLPEAIAAYEIVAEREPENDEVRRELVHLYIYVSEYAPALAYAREAEAINGDDARNLAVLALALDWNAEMDEAYSTAQLAVELAPESASTHAVLAEVLADLGSWYQAVPEAETAVELDPRNLEAQRVMGYSYEVQGKYSEAIPHYEKALELNPMLPYLYLTLGRNYRALAANQWGTAAADTSFKTAVEMFRKGLEIAPDDHWLRFELGKTLFQAGDQEIGIRELRKATELKPDMPEAYSQLGVALYLRRAYEEAIEIMERAVELGGISDINYYIIGLSYLNLEEEDCENGVPWLLKALEENPEAGPALDGLERCGVPPP